VRTTSARTEPHASVKSEIGTSHVNVRKTTGDPCVLKPSSMEVGVHLRSGVHAAQHVALVKGHGVVNVTHLLLDLMGVTAMVKVRRWKHVRLSLVQLTEELVRSVPGFAL